jgi:hypothetical protein
MVGKREEKRQFGRARSKWEDNIRMDLVEIHWEDVSGCNWLRIGTCRGLFYI